MAYTFRLYTSKALHARNISAGGILFESAQALECDTLLKLAPTYKPNHDDGVQISAAPLWPLFRHKPWQKVLKDTWAKIDKGGPKPDAGKGKAKAEAKAAPTRKAKTAARKPKAKAAPPGPLGPLGLPATPSMYQSNASGSLSRL